MEHPGINGRDGILTCQGPSSAAVACLDASSNGARHSPHCVPWPGDPPQYGHTPPGAEADAGATDSVLGPAGV